VVTSYRI